MPMNSYADIGQNDIVHDFNKSEGDTVIDDCEMIHS